MLKEDKCFYEKKIVYLDYLERDTKVKNGGFIKWESKGETSRVQIHIRGLYPTDTLQGEIFIVSRSETFAADSIALKYGTGEYAAIWKNENLAGTKISYDECDGIQLRLSENRMLKGIWREREKIEDESDDEISDVVEVSGDKIESQEIVEQLEDGEEENTEELLRTVIESVKKDSVMPIHNVDRNMRDESPTGMQSPSPEPMHEEIFSGRQSPIQSPSPTIFREERPTGVQNPNPVTFREERFSGMQGPAPEPEREERPSGVQRPAEVQESVTDEPDSSINDLSETAYETLGGVRLEKVQPKWVSDWRQPKQEQTGQDQSKWDQPMQEHTRWDQPRQEQPKQEQPRWDQPQQEQPKQEQPKQEQPKQEQPKQEQPKGGKTREHKPTQLSGDKWEQLCRQYNKIHPFGDDREYLSVTPRDFVVLGRQYQNLVQNSFLLHGYYNYGHCILAKIMQKDEECFYLGVPGVYYDREKQAALMFGFEGFEAGKEHTSEGGFGYYMKQVEI